MLHRSGGNFGNFPCKSKLQQVLKNHNLKKIMSRHTNAFCSSTCAVFLILSAIAFERGRELYILRQNIFCMNPTSVQLTVQSKHNSTHILNILNFNCDIFKRYIMRVTIPFFLLALVINVTRSWPTVNKIFFQVLNFCLGVKNWFQLHKLKLSFSASLWFQLANHDDFTENEYSGLRVLRPKPVFY